MTSMSMKLDELSKEQLIDLVKQLKSRKRFGLVWEDKPEKVVERCKTELPVLEEVKEREITSNAELPINLIIEGDNYHALSVLNYTHAGKIDVIYIDPPYNTGNKDFKYNDNFVDREDGFRHSKWVAFMYKRLSLARHLLKSDGIIFISIDDNEFAQLKLLCNDIFDEKNFIGTITWEKRTKSQNTKTARTMLQSKTEYILVYKKGGGRVDFKLDVLGEKIYDLEDEIGPYRKKVVEQMSTKGMRARKTMIFPILGISPKEEFQWKVGKDFIDKYLNRNDIEIIEGRPYLKVRPEDESNKKFVPFWSHFFDKESSGTAEKGKAELTKVLGNDEHGFETVKPINLILKLLSHINRDKKELVLDFFAGSGTTAHAILELNRRDNGDRKFILCTNNDNGIAEEICYPRIKKVIEGYSDVKGIPANVKYFRTSFVKKSTVTDDTRIELVNKSVEMICVKEGTYEEVVNQAGYKIFKDTTHSMGILFNLEELALFKKTLVSLKIPSSIYVFSLTNDTYDSDFENLAIEHQLCPIPESILEVYRKLFKE